MYFADPNGNHDFIIGKDPYYSGPMYYFMKKGTPYQSDFNIRLLALSENGIMSHLMDIFRNDNKKNGRKLAKILNRTSRPKPNEVLTNENLIGAYILTGSMIGVSLVCLILECIFKPKGRKNTKSGE